MIKALILFAAILFAEKTSFAQKKTEQHWGATFLDVAYAAAATDDGGYIITGLTNSMDADHGDIVVIKTNSKGDTLWTMVYGGPKLEGGNSVIQTKDGGYLVAGHTEDFGAQDCDAFMMKLDKNGKYEWLKVYGGEADDISEGVIQMPDGGYIFAGITASYGNAPGADENRHVYFVRTSSTGDMLWSRCYPSPFADYGYSIASMPKGGFLAVGWYSEKKGAESDGWLFRLTDNGDTVWTRLYKKDGDTKYYKIIPTIDNGYIIAGYTTPTKSGKPNGLIVKLDADGNQLWEKILGSSTGGIVFHDVAQLPNGNLMLTGTSYATDTMGMAYTIMTDQNGNKISDELSGGSNSYATSIALQGNNSYLIAGAATQYGDNYGDLYYMLVDNTTSNVPSITLTLPRIYPNPVKDKSSVILPLSEAYQTADMEVTDMDGKHIYSVKHVMAKDLVIYRNDLQAGSYIFRICCENGKIYRGKFTID